MNVSVLNIGNESRINNISDPAFLSYGVIDEAQEHQNILNTYINLGAMYEKLNEVAKAIEVYKCGIGVAKLYGNKKVARELSYTLLGLVE